MRTISAEIVNMVMIYDKASGKCLVLDRRGSWPGLTFPGGHVENGESFYDSAIREAKEETGLDVHSLTPCGVVDWADKSTGKRYIEYLYKTCEFDGETVPSTREGSIIWMSPDELRTTNRLSMNFEKYLPMFFDGKYSEMFFEWDGEAWDGAPQYK